MPSNGHGGTVVLRLPAREMKVVVPAGIQLIEVRITISKLTVIWDDK